MAADRDLFAKRAAERLGGMHRCQAGTIVTQNEVFYIPFTASPSAGSDMLLLFVSGDAGNSWQLYQRQPASAGKFSFRAAVDGEFWFAVRVASPELELSPSIDAPELVVAVDRRRPALTVLGAKSPNGQVVCRWSAEDAHFDLDSTRIEFQVAGQPDWSPATEQGQPAFDANQPDVVFGHAILPGLTLGQTIRLRVTVRDTAGNETTTEREYDPSALPLVSDLHTPPPSESDNGSSSATDPSLPIGVDSPPPAENLPLAVSSSPPVSYGDSTYGWDAARTQPSHSPSDTSQMVVNTYRRQDGLESLGVSPPAPSLPIVASDAASQVPVGADRTTFDRNNTGPTENPYSAHRNQDSFSPTAQLVEPFESKSATNATDAKNVNQSSDMLPSSHRMSKSRRFEIDYDLQDVSFGSVHRVEVWFTGDGGRTWRHHGDDEDRQSPYLMQVDSDGLYGVRLLVQTRVGYNVRPPGTGDPADIWINVDSTPPTARITSVEYGRDTSASQLEIHWDAQDPNLADNPITLLFSDSTEGPWRRVVVDLPNTGTYRWPIDDRAPQRSSCDWKHATKRGTSR